mgnify:CR=1 FL=1
MKRKLFSMLLALVFVPVLLIPAQASLMGAQIIDSADLLSDQETIELESKAENLMDTYGMDVVILTLDSLNGYSPQNKADDFYDENGYGDNGVLFLLAMEEREWYISTSGDAIYALTDYGIQQVGFVMVPYLSQGDYYGAFDVFLDELPMYFDALEKGKPVDGYADYSGDREEVLYYEEDTSPSLLVSLFFGVVAGGLTVLIMRGTMNTKKPQRSAGEYLIQDSYQLNTVQDLFLYSQVQKVRRQESSSGSGGGGSSVHRSSSGRSHGGGGGRF